MANPEREMLAFFVGRETEIELLNRTLEQCIVECRPRTVLISGDIGVGKTWLAEYFLAKAKTRHPEILIGRGRCSMETEQNGLVPFIEILRALAQHSLRSRVTDSGVSNFIMKIAPAWLDVITQGMGSAVARTVKELKNVVRYDKFSQENVFVQYSQALARIAHSHPTICFIDDLHWADASSLSLLFHLVRNLVDCRLMLLCTLRIGEKTADERQSELVNKIVSNLPLNEAIEIELTSGLDVADYVAKRYPFNLIPHPFIRQVQEVTQGHPLFLSALFSNWEQTPALTYMSRPDGTKIYFIKDESSISFEIPKTLGNAVKERLEHLNESEHRVLEYAAIEGNNFTAQVVACASGLGEVKTFEILRSLQHQHHLVIPDPAKQDESADLDFCHFIHRFYREFIYNRIGLSRRKLLHRSVAECLERIYPNRAAIAGRLAFHFGQSGDYLQQALYALQAAKFEQERWAWSESAHWCNTGLKALEQVKPITLETEALRIQLLIYLGQSSCLKGDYNVSEKQFQEALALAQETKANRTVTAEICSQLAYLYDVTGHIEKSSEYALQGLEILGEPTISEAFLSAKLQLDYAGALSRQGLDERALSVCDSLLTMITSMETTSEIQRLLPVVHNYRGIALGNLGRFEEAKKAYQEAIKEATCLGDIRLCGMCWLNLAYDSLQQNQAEEAEKFIERGEPLSRRAGDLDTLAYAKAVRGSVLLSRGLAQPAEHELLSAIVESEELGSNWNMVDMYSDLALAQLLLGRLDDAEQTAAYAVSIGEASGDPMDIGTAYIALGRVKTALGHFSEAEQILRQAYTVHSHANHPHLAARALGFLGDSLLKAGRFADAVQELEHAIQIFKELKLDRAAEPFEHLLNQAMQQNRFSVLQETSQ